MNRSDYIKHLKSSIETLEMCTAHEDNFCPTCRDSAKLNKQISAMFEDTHIERCEEIRKANEAQK